MVKIVVVGAGVTGLTTAYLLSERGHDVTIISKRFHFDGYDDPQYTSNFAGANWASFASKDEVRLQKFDAPSYLKLMYLARNEPGSGIHLQYNVSKVTKNFYSSNKEKFPTYDAYLPWYKDLVEEFKVIPGSELGEEFEFGISYLGVVISTNIYLGYLFNKCAANRVKYKRRNLSHIMDVDTQADLIINCTGLLSKYLGGVEDQNMFPIKGQTIVVENNFPTKLSVREVPTHPGEGFYLMPRVEGGCVIGGCMLPDNWDGKPDLAMSERIAAKALKFCSQLVDPSYDNNPTELKIIRHQVGLRPGRKGDVRVERDPKFKKLIHNYGAGGTGFQSSYGTCGEVVKIVDSILYGSNL